MKQRTDAARTARRSHHFAAGLRRFADELDAQSRLAVTRPGGTGSPLAAAAGRSNVGPVAQRAVQVMVRVAPTTTRRFKLLRRSIRAAAVLGSDGVAGLVNVMVRRRQQTGAYEEWRRRHEPSAAELQEMRELSRTWGRAPLVSLVMPTYNSRPEWLRPAIESVLAQSYERWQLCIADDASTDPSVTPLLDDYASRDQRITVVRRPVNGGIAEASQSALDIANGDLVGFLDHDDELRPHALHRVVEAWLGASDADVIYSDEDLLLEDGTYGRPFFKPDYSPDFLLSNNYMCHFMVMRTELVREVGGLRSGFDGAQDHDLLLRATERARRVVHIPDILYAWRQVPGSVALSGDAKMYAYEAGERAVAEALARRGLEGRVIRGDDLGTYHVRLAVLGAPPVAIIIPTRDRVELLRQCISAVEDLSTYGAWSITVVDNGSVEAATLRYLETCGHQIIRRPGGFNYSALINAGRDAVDAPYIITLNNDATVLTPDWIEAMLEQAQRPEVAIVGPRLIYPDGRPQSEGIGVGNVAGGYLAANLDAGWMGRIIRDVSAVTGACQMITTTVFDELGGYDEELGVAYNDVDFCLRARRAGYLVVYTPHAVVVHSEGSSRGSLDPRPDHRHFWQRWGVEGGIPDPYINPNIRSLNPPEIRLDRLPLEQ